MTSDPMPQGPAPPEEPAPLPGSVAPSGPPRLIPAIAWVVFVLIAGGGLASYSAQRFDHLGLLAIWGIGWASGSVASKILGGTSRLIGSLLVGSCFTITLFTMVAWIRAEIVEAEDSWGKAVALLPTFVQEFPIFAIVSLIVLISGSASAWRCVAHRYVLVRVQ